MIYIGNYANSPVKRCEPDQVTYPKDFKKVAHDCFTNNPHYLDAYKPEEVIIVTETKLVPLIETKIYKIFKDEMSSGEMWSCIDISKL